MSTSKPSLLIVDDDLLQRELVKFALEPHFRIVERDTGVGLCDSLAGEILDLVLLDIVMPEVDGYATCRALRQDARLAEVPVLFLSGQIEREDRLEAYNAGGEDFIAKPFDPDELRAKVAATLQRVAARRQAEESARDAFSTAMTAISSSGEQGVVMHALRRSFSSTHLADLAAVTLRATTEFGLDACIWLQSRQGESIMQGGFGLTTPIEESVLRHLAKGDTLQRLGRQVAYHYGGLTLLIKDLPIQDPDRAGRLRDHLALLAEAIASRLVALDDHLLVERQRATLSEVVRSTIATLEAVDERFQEQRSESSQILSSMLERIEVAFLRVGLTEEQEEGLIKVIQDALTSVSSVGARGLAISGHVSRLLENLEKHQQ